MKIHTYTLIHSAAGESDFSRKTAVLAITYLSEEWRICRSPSDAHILKSPLYSDSISVIRDLLVSKETYYRSPSDAHILKSPLYSDSYRSL